MAAEGRESPACRANLSALCRFTTYEVEHLIGQGPTTIKQRRKLVDFGRLDRALLFVERDLVSGVVDRLVETRSSVENPLPAPSAQVLGDTPDQEVIGPSFRRQ